MTKLADRIEKLEGRALPPQFRIVSTETIWADDDETAKEAKVEAAIALDRATTGFTGNYIVMVWTSTKKHPSLP